MPLHPGPEWHIFCMSPSLWVSYRSMTSRFPPFAFVELVSPYNKKNITRWLEDLNFMFVFSFHILPPPSCKHITTPRRFKCVFQKWLIPLDVVAWRLSLFLWALLSVASESISNNFGFIRLEKGEIFWKETSKDWNNAAIKAPWSNWLVNVPFCSRRVNDYEVITVDIL